MQACKMRGCGSRQLPAPLPSPSHGKVAPPPTPAQCHQAQRTLYSGGIDGRLLVWNLADGRARSRGDFEDPSGLNATAPPQPTVGRGGLPPTQPAAAPHRGHCLMRLLVLEEEQLLVSAASDGKVVIWSLPNGKAPQPKREFRHHARGAHALAFCAAHETIVSAASEPHIFIWAPTLPDWIEPTKLSGHERAVEHVFASATAPEVISIDVGGAVRVWDVRVGRCVQRLEMPARRAFRH